MLNGLTRKELGTAADVLRLMLASGETLLRDALPVLEKEMALRLKKDLQQARPVSPSRPQVHGVCPQCQGPLYKERLSKCQCPKTLPRCSHILYCADDTCTHYEIKE